MEFKYEIWIEIWNRNSSIEFEHGIEYRNSSRNLNMRFQNRIWNKLWNRIFKVELEIEFQIGFQNRKSKWFWNGIWIQGNSNGFEWRNSNGVGNEFEY